jgi:hypothetical protein
MTVWAASIIWGSSKSCNSWRKGLRRRGALQSQCNSWHDCVIGDFVDMLRLQVVATVEMAGINCFVAMMGELLHQHQHPFNDIRLELL